MCTAGNMAELRESIVGMSSDIVIFRACWQQWLSGSAHRCASSITIVCVFRLIDDLPGHDGRLILVLPASVVVDTVQQHSHVVLEGLQCSQARPMCAGVMTGAWTEFVDSLWI